MCHGLAVVLLAGSSAVSLRSSSQAVLPAALSCVLCAHARASVLRAGGPACGACTHEAAPRRGWSAGPGPASQERLVVSACGGGA